MLAPPIKKPDPVSMVTPAGDGNVMVPLSTPQFDGVVLRLPAVTAGG